MVYDFKYAKKTTNLVVAILWSITFAINAFILVMFAFTPIRVGIYTLLIVFSMLLNAFLVQMYARLYFGYRTYITIEGDWLSKDQGIWPKKVIQISDISKTLIIGDKLRLSTNNDDEIKINLDCLKMNDIFTLKEILKID